MYFYVLFGFLLFPMGILALIGYFNSAKKYLIIFLPTLLFLLFHTWFPNRQERFILTIFPLVICLSVMGIALLRERKFWNGFWKVSLVAFWILNIPFKRFFEAHYCNPFFHIDVNVFPLKCFHKRIEKFKQS